MAIRASCPLAVCIFITLSLSSSLPHCLSLSLSPLLSFLLMSSLCSCLPSVPPSLLSSVPVVLTSCPAVEGGRSRGGRGMLILSPQRRSAQGDTERKRARERERGRKCHSSEEMRWPFHCVCVCLHRKDRGDSLSDILCISLRFGSAPLLSK